jgi:hypothetical protein
MWRMYWRNRAYQRTPYFRTRTAQQWRLIAARRAFPLLRMMKPASDKAPPFYQRVVQSQMRTTAANMARLLPSLAMHWHVALLLQQVSNAKQPLIV